MHPFVAPRTGLEYARPHRKASPLSLLVLPAMIGLAILVWRRRGRIDPAPR